MKTIDDDIAWWKAQSDGASSKRAALLAFGAYAGLKVAKSDYLKEVAMPIDVLVSKAVSAEKSAEHEEPTDFCREHGLCSECGAKLARGWQPINLAPLSDDLIWLYNSVSKSIEGPRPLFEYDADKFDYWAPCEPPQIPEDI